MYIVYTCFYINMNSSIPIPIYYYYNMAVPIVPFYIQIDIGRLGAPYTRQAFWKYLKTFRMHYLYDTNIIFRQTWKLNYRCMRHFLSSSSDKNEYENFLLKSKKYQFTAYYYYTITSSFAVYWSSLTRFLIPPTTPHPLPTPSLSQSLVTPRRSPKPI